MFLKVAKNGRKWMSIDNIVDNKFYGIKIKFGSDSFSIKKDADTATPRSCLRVAIIGRLVTIRVLSDVKSHLQAFLD